MIEMAVRRSVSHLCCEAGIMGEHGKGDRPSVETAPSMLTSVDVMASGSLKRPVESTCMVTRASREGLEHETRR
jgi:hypothetical protein